MADQTVYSIPKHVRDHISSLGYPLPCDAMQGHINAWDLWRRSEGDFYDWNEVVNGARLSVHRRSIHPAKKVSDEFAKLLFNDKTDVVCEDQKCTERLRALYGSIGFFPRGQKLVSKAFSLGTCAWAVWVDFERGKLQIRRYDAKTTIPLSWDDDGIYECAFCTRASLGGKQVDQLTMHVLGDDGYHVATKCWTLDGKEIEADGVLEDWATKSGEPLFAVFVPFENTIVDTSPYGESIYAHCTDQLEGVDLAYDAMLNEIEQGKMRLFISDMLIEYQDRDEGGKAVKRPLPFGRDNVIFRKVSANDDVIKEFAPQLRVEQQIAVFRTAFQTLGDSCGFGLNYFDVDDSGGIKTATEVSSDNSVLMRTIKEHENLLGQAVAQISRAALFVLREHFGEDLPDEGEINVTWDDSIITDTAAEKQQDMAEVGVTMNDWEYRMKWYGEDEATARSLAAEIGGTSREEPFGE